MHCDLQSERSALGGGPGATSAGFLLQFGWVARALWVGGWVAVSVLSRGAPSLTGPESDPGITGRHSDTPTLGPPSGPSARSLRAMPGCPVPARAAGRGGPGHVVAAQPPTRRPGPCAGWRRACQWRPGERAAHHRPMPRPCDAHWQPEPPAAAAAQWPGMCATGRAAPLRLPRSSGIRAALARASAGVGCDCGCQWASRWRRATDRTSL